MHKYVCFEDSITKTNLPAYCNSIAYSRCRTTSKSASVRFDCVTQFNSTHNWSALFLPMPLVSIFKKKKNQTQTNKKNQELVYFISNTGKSESESINRLKPTFKPLSLVSVEALFMGHDLIRMKEKEDQTHDPDCRMASQQLIASSSFTSVPPITS